MIPMHEALESTPTLITTFGGLNHNLTAQPGEWFNEVNLSTDAYPLLTTRKERVKVEGLEGLYIKQILSVNMKDANGLHEDGYVVLNDNGYLHFYDCELDELAVKAIGNTETMIAQAGYLYTFPSKKRIKLFDLAANAEDLEAVNVGGEGTTVTLSPCDAEGEDLSSNFITKRGADVNPNRANHVKNHFDLYDNTGTTNWQNHTNIKYDSYFTVVNGVVTAKGYPVPTNSSGKPTITPASGDVTKNFICVGHGNGGNWIRDYIKVGFHVLRDWEGHPTWFNVYGSGVPVSVGGTRPASPVNGQRWVDTENKQIYTYSDSQQQWVTVPLNYIRIDCDDSSMFTGFREGDVIETKGLGEDYDSYYHIRKLIKETDADGNESVKSIIVDGLITNKVTINVANEETVTFERRVPDMEYITESNNRLWGCHYGINEEGEVINEVYCSALGDPFNWHKYQNTAADSWTATIGVDGRWTGAVTYGGYPIFFKENCIIRIYGSAPSSYQTSEQHYRGVKHNSHKSLCVVDEVLYYHSHDGMMAYTGGIPTKIDTQLGDEVMTSVVCGGANHKLYVRATKDDGDKLYVYDTRYGIWHEECELMCEGFFSKNELIFYINAGSLYMPNKAVRFKESWSCESIPQGYGDINKKRLKSVRIKAILPYGSEMSVYSSYDDGEWELDASCEGTGEGKTDIAFFPKQCEHYRIKLCGKGECTIVSLYYEVEYGGE